MDTLPQNTYEGKFPFILIPLTRECVAIIDPEDADLLSYQWYANESMYAYREALGENSGSRSMHRIILERKLQRPIQKGMIADHKNGLRIDNRRSNLREVTPLQNYWNSRAPMNSKTGYKGVSCRKGFYIAKIRGRTLGVFNLALDASLCYDKAALEEYGEYARLNNPLERVQAWEAPN